MTVNCWSAFTVKALKALTQTSHSEDHWVTMPWSVRLLCWVSEWVSERVISSVWRRCLSEVAAYSVDGLWLTEPQGVHVQRSVSRGRVCAVEPTWTWLGREVWTSHAVRCCCSVAHHRHRAPVQHRWRYKHHLTVHTTVNIICCWCDLSVWKSHLGMPTWKQRHKRTSNLPVSTVTEIAMKHIACVLL